MGLAPTRRPARTISMSELARMLSTDERPVSTETARRRVLRLVDPRRALPAWLSQGNGLRGNRHYRINLSLMRAAHPAFFDAPSVEDVEESLDAVREENAELRAIVRALGAKIRDLSKRVAVLEGRVKTSSTHDKDDDEPIRPFAIGAEATDPHHGLPPGWSKGL